MFVTAGDFNNKPYSIPNLQLYANTFPVFIEDRERYILISLLGLQLYRDFVSGLDALPQEWAANVDYTIGERVVYGVDIFEALADSNNVTPAPGAEWDLIEAGNKWLTLEKGATYTVYGVLREWVGMNKMLVPYVYSRWLRASFDTFTGIGIVEAKAENSEVKEPKKRIVDAYNDFMRMAGNAEAMGCCCSSQYAAPYVDDCDSPGTLAGFISAANIQAPGTYANWHYTDPEEAVTTFGL